MLSGYWEVFNLPRRKIRLPIDQHEKSLLYLLERHRVLIVAGETGSGKSSRIPGILYNSGQYNNTILNSRHKQMICITQPRRATALELALRLSQELVCNIGSTVGFAYRFQEATNEDTLIKFVTEGLLIREMMSDPLLMKYSIIMIDEVHERNLNTDLLLGLLKCILIKRKDLKLIICSTTLDIDEFTTYFSFSNKFTMGDETLKEPAVLIIEGTSYPVRIYYRVEAVPDYVKATIETIIQLHEFNRLASGNILAFLTGQDEVDYVCSQLSDYAHTSSSRLDLRKLVILPLYASLRQRDISKVFEVYPKDTRVCVISTNIAETSLTINDIAFVVDCGFVKLKVHNSKTGIESLVRMPISKSSAKQRAGCAGRTRDGEVYRLFTEEEYRHLRTNTIPEVQRAPLAETIMLLKSLQVHNLLSFPLMSRLPRGNLAIALEQLYALKAIDNEGCLTATGELMTKFNLDPKLSKILISPESSSCTLEACKIIAMLQVKDIYSNNRNANSVWANSHLSKICASEGDLLSYLNIIMGFINNNKSDKWTSRRSLNWVALDNAVKISDKLEAQLKQNSIGISSCNGRIDLVQRSMVSGLFSNAAYLHPSGNYRTVIGDQVVYIHPTSVFSELPETPKFVIFAEIINTTKTYIRHIMAIDQDFLLDAAPEFYTFTTDLESKRNNHTL